MAERKSGEPGACIGVQRGIFIRLTKTKGPQYGISYTYKGKLYRKIVGPSKTAAKQALMRCKADIADELFNAPTKKHVPTFDEFATEYMKRARGKKDSWKRDDGCMARFSKTFGRYHLDEITAHQIEQYKMDRSQHTVPRTKRRITHRTVNLELSLLRRMFNVAIKSDYLKANPMRNVEFYKLDEQPMRVLSPKEETKLLAVASPHLARVIVFALNTGMRRGEILNLKWSDVDREAWKLTLAGSDTKTGKTRTIPLNPVAQQVLRECGVNLNRETYVFGYKGAHVERVYTAWRAAVRRANIPWIRFHDLRHTFATRLAEKGVSVIHIQALMGHRDIETTMRYMHTNEEFERAAVEKLCDPQTGSL